MSSWFSQQNNFSTSWLPEASNGLWSGCRANYDRTTGEIFITNKDDCLCYNTQFGEFTGFFDYQNTPSMFTIDDTVLVVGKDRTKDNDYSNLWRHRKNYRKYCTFFNKQYPSHIEVVCNGSNDGSDYGTDKIFDNLSWRAEAWKWDSVEQAWEYLPFTTFTSVSGSNNYQSFYRAFDPVNGIDGDAQLSHPLMPLNLRKKFKVWYSTFPRAGSLEDEQWVETRDRIRDTWCHVRFTINAATTRYRHIIHDLVISYFIP
jgi:hypothetical protein